jgi:SAM-dependent methyltransferase
VLEELRITGLGVIDDTTLRLTSGMNVITGETGAGKTMVVTGLGLLFGGRADAGRVRADPGRAVVEGRLRLAGPAAPGVQARVEEAGGEIDDDGTVLLSRTVTAEGRSRAHVGGRAVPAGVLAEVGRVLRPGGALVLAESVDDNPLLRLGRRLHASWDGVGIHARFTARSLLDEVAGAGLDVVEHRQHSLVSFAAWALPAPVDRPAWHALTGLEGRLPPELSRWGAHLECVARRP